MRLISKYTEDVTIDNYTIQLEDGRIVLVKEYVNDKGKVIDTDLRDEDGNPINIDDGGALILEQVQKFLDDTEGA